MEMNEYQRQAKKTLRPECDNLEYLALGLNGEAGEVADKIKKVIRGDGELNEVTLMSELGDVLYYVAMLAQNIGFDLEYVAWMNNRKLENRVKNGTLKGSGDNI